MVTRPDATWTAVANAMPGSLAPACGEDGKRPQAYHPVDRYVVIGNPVAHSKSPVIHALFAQATGQLMQYDTLLAPLDGFATCVAAFREQGGRGANVTLPFKLEAFALAHELSPRATAAGAVNTLKFDDGMIAGDNTDGIGLVRDITVNANVTLAGKRVLMLGAGGAARGALLPLLDAGVEQIVVANRTLANADALVAQFALPHQLGASSFEKVEGVFDVIINATSASLQHSLPPVPATAIGPATLAYDMMYGKQATVFMQWAATHGAQVRDGLGMLVEQAACAFAWWRGVQPDTGAVYARLRAELA